MAIKEISFQNTTQHSHYISKLFYLFVPFCWFSEQIFVRKLLAVLTCPHEGAGEANSFRSKGCLWQEKQPAEVTFALLVPLVLFPSPLPKTALAARLFCNRVWKINMTCNKTCVNKGLIWFDSNVCKQQRSLVGKVHFCVVISIPVITLWNKYQ